MKKSISLSELVGEIEEAIDYRFEGELFLIKAEITDVKKYEDKRWCFLKFIEKQGGFVSAEIRGVFWNSSYRFIDLFERSTKQVFGNGLEITCVVRVKFHKRYGITLEVVEIDQSFTLGKLEMERQKTLERLLNENGDLIRLVDGQYVTRNNNLELPVVMQRVALITAVNSDGQRDFMEELRNNQYGYAFVVGEFLCQIQGDTASTMLLEQLKIIEENAHEFDVVAIVRGGGSIIDLKPFDDYELARFVAGFPLPVLTGIGHDRNVSIVDLMGRMCKTPTKVANVVVEHNMFFESRVMTLRERIEKRRVRLLDNARSNLNSIKRIVNSYSPERVLRKGYAIVRVNDKIVTSGVDIKVDSAFEVVMSDEIISGVVTNKKKNEYDV